MKVCAKCRCANPDDATICQACGSDKIVSSKQEAPLPTEQANSMDFRKLSQFIMAFGLILICVGGFNLLSNLPLSPPQVAGASDNSMQGFIAAGDQQEKNMETEVQNENRSFKRQGALKFIGAGAVISFAAIAIMLSARKPKPI